VIVLLLVGFLGGLVTGISPCILPVLPVIFASGAASGLDDGPDGSDRSVTVSETVPVEAVGVTVEAPSGSVGGRGAGLAGTPPRSPSPNREAQLRLDAARRRRRPLAVVSGLVLSFSVFTLLGSWLLGTLGLPDDLLRWIGIVLLGVLGLGLLVPLVGDLLERPFARLTAGREVSEGGGFVLGLSLGLVFVPCAGPVLATITVVGNDHHIGWSAVLLTAAFAVGVAIPLLLFASAGQFLASRMRTVRSHVAMTRRVIGAVLMVTAVVLAFNLTDGVQRAVPGYTDALAKNLESNSSAARALDGVRGVSDGGSLANCTDASPVLQECGRAPEFTGITAWLNTLGERPLTMAGLKGRVVLVDFWTYSCINCQRSLPHVEAWNAAYSRFGLTVVGVHTPEFAFEHVVSNVAQSAAQLGVHYPVAVDNDYGTWNAYQNNYWPAEYLIDASGTVRHADFGEGEYSQTETFIRRLLVAAHPTVSLPPRTGVPDRSTQSPTTPESYLGYHYTEPNLVGESVQRDTMAAYSPPADLPQDTFAFGGHWDVGSEGAVAGGGATLALRFQSEDVYLVLAGTGTVQVAVDGRAIRTVAVGGVPTLRTLVGPGAYQHGLLTLSASPGVTAYDFTFG
jgi:cytochrome c biogenesis protein CcdA/thiol-disulfide isomerase/thioredoxin